MLPGDPSCESDPHQPGEQGVFEIGRVEDARGEHHDVRVVDAGRGGGAERLEQLVRVLPDRAHPHRHEQLRQGLGHHPAVGDDVADPAGHPHIVLEDAPGSLLVADQVDA
jgi:hypothetical protein